MKSKKRKTSHSDMLITTHERPLRIKEVAEFLKVSRPTVYKYISMGMPAHQKNKTYMFLYASEVTEWIKGLR
jgi:excisionase family DNA binding protein